MPVATTPPRPVATVAMVGNRRLPDPCKVDIVDTAAAKKERPAAVWYASAAVSSTGPSLALSARLALAGAE